MIKIVLCVTLQLLNYSLYTRPRIWQTKGWVGGGFNFKAKVKVKIYIFFVLYFQGIIHLEFVHEGCTFKPDILFGISSTSEGNRS